MFLIFAKDRNDRGLVSKIYKQLTWLNTTQTNSTVEMWEEAETDISPKKTDREPRGTQKDVQNH